MNDLLFPSLQHPSTKTAIEVGAEALSYAQLRLFVMRHAARLKEQGFQPGDRVGVWTTGGLAAPATLVAQAALGITTVPLNPKLGPKELDHILRDAEPRFVVGPSDYRNKTPEHAWLDATIDLNESDTQTLAGATPETALILYTSGTTGAPKGAMITRRNIAANLDALAATWQWRKTDTVVHALPLFHVHGLVLGLFGSIRVGGCLHWQQRFDPTQLSASLAKGQTMLFAVPTLYHRLAEAAEQDPNIAVGLRSARLLISGSAGLPVREHRRIESLSGRGVLERYGLTETLINCGVPCASGPAPGYVGPPLPGIELRLVDDQRTPLDTRDDKTIGEVAVRGPHVFKGYLNRPEATAKVRDEEGWFYTGDLATRDVEGRIRIVGRRATDLIKTGGFKVGAGEVEAALLEHPAVREVAVVGIPDPDLGEKIVAFVVARDQPPETQTLIDLVAAQLTPHKRPRDIHYVEALPRNAMGKVMKPTLKAQFG